MWDLRTMKQKNDEADHNRPDFIRFRHDEVEYVLEQLSILSNPPPILRSVIKKFEMIRDIQKRAYERRQREAQQ